VVLSNRDLSHDLGSLPRFSKKKTDSFPPLATAVHLSSSLAPSYTLRCKRYTVLQQGILDPDILLVLELLKPNFKIGRVLQAEEFLFTDPEQTVKAYDIACSQFAGRVSREATSIKTGGCSGGKVFPALPIGRMI